MFFGAIVRNLCMDDLLQWESERTKEFAARCRNVSRECYFNERAGECGVIRFTTSTKFFVLDKAKLIPMRTGSQTAWEAVKNDFIEKRSRSRKRSLISVAFCI